MNIDKILIKTDNLLSFYGHNFKTMYKEKRQVEQNNNITIRTI